MLFKKKLPTILVFRTGQLGDTLVAMPAMKFIRDQFPNYRLILLTDKHAEKYGYVSSWSLVKSTGWFDEVLFYEPTQSYFGQLANMVRLAGRIRALAPDRIFDLTSYRTKFQTRRDRIFYRRLAGIPQVHGCALTCKPPRGIDGLLPRIEPEWHRLVRLVGGDPTTFLFSLPIPSADRDIAHMVMEQSGLPTDAPVIAFGPGSKMAAKRWPAERFVHVGQAILDRFEDSHLVVLGGREDEEVGALLCRQWGGRSHNLAGELSIYGSAEVLSRCALYVGNDTGTMHLAAMAGTTCVALFSARDYPGWWEPVGSEHVILREETHCSGCMLEACLEHDNLCLKQIGVNDVIAAVEHIFLRGNPCEGVPDGGWLTVR